MSVPIAIEIMLPKLALVVMATYLKVFANVRRPSITPSLQHVEVALQQHDVGGLARDVDRLRDGDADVGDVQRGGVVDAVAEEGHGVTALLQREHDALLLLGIDLGEDVGALGEMPERLIARLVDLATREQVLGVEPNRLADVGCHVAVVAGDELDRDAGAREREDGRLDCLLQRIEEQEEALEHHLASSSRS